MKKKPSYFKVACLVLFTVLTTTAFALNETSGSFWYENQWRIIDDYTKQDRPESALSELEILLKASVQKMALDLQKDVSKAPEIIAGFESLIEGATNPSEKALMQSMTAELYLKYYQQNSYKINQQTSVLGYTPKELTEWTKVQFSEKIFSLLNASLSPEEQLKKTATKSYSLLLDSTGSVESVPTLFDFLAKREIDILIKLRNLMGIYTKYNNTDYLLPADQFHQRTIPSNTLASVDSIILSTYQRWLKLRIQETDTKAYLFADLSRLKTLYSTFYNYYNQLPLNPIDENYVQSLQTLYNRYQNNENIIPTLHQLVTFYQNPCTNVLENIDFSRSGKTVYSFLAKIVGFS